MTDKKRLRWLNFPKKKLTLVFLLILDDSLTSHHRTRHQIAIFEAPKHHKAPTLSEFQSSYLNPPAEKYNTKMTSKPNEIVQRDHCQKILENYLKSQNFELENYKVESLADKVTGMMAEYYSLKIVFTFEGKRQSKQCFCKKLAMFHQVQEIMGKAQGAFEKEAFIYNFLKPECSKIPGYNLIFAPECYFTIEHDLFVLEDLSELQYEIVNSNHNIDQCKMALETIAKFHASSVIYEEKQTLSKGSKYCLNDEYKHIFEDSLYRNDEMYLGRHWFKNCLNTVKKIVEISPLKDNKKLKDNLEKYSEKIYDIVQPSHTFNNVLCHGDLSEVNIMFKTDPKTNLPVDCKLIDFQALRYTPPAHDVMTYLVLNTNKQFRKKHLNELLEWYYIHFHHELDDHCVNKDKHMVLEMFRESCDYVLPMVVLQALFYETMGPIDEYPQINLDQDLYREYVYGDRSPQCLAVYGKGGLFKKKFDELMEKFSQM